MGFGARLAEARKRKQLTQDGLGKGLGTDGKDASKAVVYGWEKDQHFPRVDQLVLICERLGVSADHLLFGASVDGVIPEVAEAAVAISQLPKKQRDWVLMFTWDAIKVARETLNPPAANHDVSPLETSKRMRASK